MLFDSNKGAKPTSSKPDPFSEGIERVFIGIFFFLALGLALTAKTLRTRPDLFLERSPQSRWITGLVSASIGLGAWTLARQLESVVYGAGLSIFSSWLLGFSLIWSTAPLWLRLFPCEDRITIQTLARKSSTASEKSFAEHLNNPHASPVGISLKTKHLYALPIRQRIEHMIVAGATGQGKTTLMITLANHAFLHRHPVIIIDPKGEKADIELMKSFAQALGRQPSEFKLFTLADPRNSARYNPLATGTPEQRRAKLMDGLALEHEYYGRVAGKYLGVLFDVFDFLNIEPTLANIEQALLNKKFLSSLEMDLKNAPESTDARKLRDKLNSIRQIDPKDLAGLSAQVESFNSREFASLLSPKASEPDQIKFLDILKQGQVAYFQMNVNGYGDIARRIGKLIIQDLKTASSLIHAQQTQVKVPFGACFIDEFGSFATSDFADFMKQVRSTNIGIHLFCQGMADLRAVSPEFEAQVLGNTLTKIIFRTDLAEDAEGWAGMAGTVDAFDESFQVKRGLLWTERTGMGTRNPSKKMKIDFDVFKSLKRGQAVVIDKGRGLVDLISIWDSKSAVLSSPQALATVAQTAPMIVCDEPPPDTRKDPPSPLAPSNAPVSGTDDRSDNHSDDHSADEFTPSQRTRRERAQRVHVANLEGRTLMRRSSRTRL